VRGRWKEKERLELLEVQGCIGGMAATSESLVILRRAAHPAIDYFW
jgi:hypothetical protein